MSKSEFKQYMYTVRWYAKHLLDNPNKWQEVGKALVEFSTEVIDGKAAIDEPDRPTVHYTEPSITEFEDIIFRTHGAYRTDSGMARGLIVHYTAGRNSVYDTARYMANRGLGCLLMDTGGRIYRAQHLHEVAWHAGRSQHPDDASITGMSRYCMGMEIVNPGRLERRSDGMYYSWFGQAYPEERVRYVEAEDNIAAGYYLPFSIEQEAGLIDFCKWQLSTNPEFEIDWILGHDEVSPGRKSDPGGALSMSMPQLRTLLKEWQDAK